MAHIRRSIHSRSRRWRRPTCKDCEPAAGGGLGAVGLESLLLQSRRECNRRRQRADPQNWRMAERLKNPTVDTHMYSRPSLEWHIRVRHASVSVSTTPATCHDRRCDGDRSLCNIVTQPAESPVELKPAIRLRTFRCRIRWPDVSSKGAGGTAVVVAWFPKAFTGAAPRNASRSMRSATSCGDERQSFRGQRRFGRSQRAVCGVAGALVSDLSDATKESRGPTACSGRAGSRYAGRFTSERTAAFWTSTNGSAPRPTAATSSRS